MRITTTKLTQEERESIYALIDKIFTSNDMTLSTDFGEDAYALFKEEYSKRSIMKNFWNIFYDVSALYKRYKVGDLMTNVNFYIRIKDFFKYFMLTKLFYELDKLDPMEATEKFLNMFKKQQQQQQQQQKQQQGNKKQQDKQQDQKGMSADEDNIPIDMTKFKQDINGIEKAIGDGVLDMEDYQEYLEKHAGIAHKDLNIGNISDVVNKIARTLSQKDLEIFHVARNKESLDVYKRDEVLESVLCPDNEMSIKTIDGFNEVIKTIPTQYSYDDDIFMEKLMKKELLVRDYQSRRLKKQALYMLVDVSGSMDGNSSIYASGVALALVRQAVSEGSTYFLRFFDGGIYNLHRITTKEEANNACDMLVRQPYSGGGTNINLALETAIRDIKGDEIEYEKAEIMLITDGEDTVKITKNDLKGIKLHTTIIGDNNYSLQQISDTYTKL